MNGTGDGTVRVTPKPWYASTTIWLNIAAFITAFSPLFLAYVADWGVSEQMAGRISGLSGLISAAINLFVRVFMTGAPIAGAPPASPPPEGAG